MICKCITAILRHSQFHSPAHTHLIEQQDKIDCKCDKQSQQAQIIKIPCKVILKKKEQQSSVFSLLMQIQSGLKWFSPVGVCTNSNIRVHELVLASVSVTRRPLL